MPPKMIHAQEMLEQLAENDLRFEIMLGSLIELLKTKKIPSEFESVHANGVPLLTDEEFQNKLNETQRKMVQVMSLSKSSGIIKPDTLH